MSRALRTDGYLERTVGLADYGRALWARRGGIAALVLVATALTAGVAFLLPPWYRAQASLLPPAEEDTGLGVASLFRGIGVPGIKIPTEATPAEVFSASLQSRSVNAEVVRRFDLLNLYRRHFVEDAIKELGHHASFKITSSGTIEIAVEDRSPQRAADMARAYIELLDRFNREVRMTKGRRTREFIQTRLAENEQDLAHAEQVLADYQARHKTIALSPEASSALETASRLYAQRAALEVRLGVIRNYTRGDGDEEQVVQQQIDQIDRQLQTLPETGLEIVRYLRDVRKFETLNGLLTEQFEEARINEVRDVATVDVLDPPVVPERKSRPKRVLLIGSAFALSLALGMAWAASRAAGDEPVQ